MKKHKGFTKNQQSAKREAKTEQEFKEQDFKTRSIKYKRNITIKTK